jgi:transposase-like protein
MNEPARVVKLEPPSIPELDRPRNKGEHWSPEARKQAVAYALERMSDGESLDAACRDIDINPGTVHGWIKADPDTETLYDQIKIQRSRSFIERAIDEMDNNPDFKAAESKARTLLKLAALLNPKEFSDKTHANLGKTGPNARVTFVLNVPRPQVLDKGEITVVVQPEDGTE